ncbi:hypothetical protein ONZ45_g12091 [Pleurotus djamor]|nr:hypothetical protein ONZ45_g12091 [Pleurotus djamor]
MVNYRGRKPSSRPSVEGQWLHDKAPGFKDTAAPANGASTTPTKGSKLVVAGLHYEITQKDLNYDRSGRSTGVATITYETQAEAAKALSQFNGLLAKGQPMEISYDTSVPRHPARKTTTTSLINRIQKQPLLNRLAGDAMKVDDDSSKERTSSTRGRGQRGARLGRGRGRGAGRAPRKPQTAEDLDKELEAFMGDGSIQPAADTGNAGGNGDTPAQDVDMA